MSEAFRTVVLFLPAFVANALPVILCAVPGYASLKRPINERLLGANKSWQGLGAGILAGGCTGLVMHYLMPKGVAAFALYADPRAALAFGLLLGAGALFGDVGKSFIKRRMGIKPGAPLPFWDGVDYMFGAMVFALPLYGVSLFEFAVLVLAGPIASLLANVTAYCLGWKKVWY